MNAIKFNAFFIFGKGLPITKKDLVENGVPVISYGQIHAKANSGTGLNDRLIRYVNKSYLEASKNALALVRKGDFIFADTSEDFDGVGNCVFVDKDITLFAGYHTIIVRPKDGKEYKYLSYLFKSDSWRYAALAEKVRAKATPAKQQPAKRELDFLIDIQAKIAAIKGVGYQRWAKVFNLK